MKTAIKAAIVLGIAASMSSCHIYKKYETPTSTPLTKEYAEALQQPVDSTAFGNLAWQDVFTDPVLVDLINRALVNNTNLRNAHLNVEAAQAQLQGAKLAYLPSLALAPNGAGAKYGSNSFGWAINCPPRLRGKSTSSQSFSTRSAAPRPPCCRARLMPRPCARR